MKAMTPFKTLLGLYAARIRRQPGIAAALAGLSWPLLALLSPAVGVQIQANGAGGGSGGNDANGLGGPTATSVGAMPGDALLQYTLTAVNNGTQSLSTLIVNDTTPAFTTFLLAACPGALPAGITACSVSTQPAIGAQGGLQWTFTGSLASSAQLAVTYRVKVDQ